jgi:glucose/arabinose dehydrogenase
MNQEVNRLALRVAGVACVGLAAFAAQGQTLGTVRVASGLSRPVYVTHAPGDFKRVFIIEQRSSNIGRIRILDLETGVLQPTPFLNITPVTTGSEQGLLGLAFDPGYADNGHFYVNYTAPGPGAGYTIVERYTVMENDPNIANPDSVLQILQVTQPDSNHNGGWMGFGPDGLLYIAMGDGGSGNDPWGQFGNGQNKNALLGKMLRIDPSADAFPDDDERYYSIPAENPFVDADGADEIWAWGLRNPWRNSFDRLTGDLWIADVGQNLVEEVNFQPASSAGGENYGWRCMEGFNCTGLTGCECDADELTDPIHVYTHGGNPFRCSITGGYVYRGCAIPGLDGAYFFGDYCSNQIWSLRLIDGQVEELTDRSAELAPGGGLSIVDISGFGEDAYGEMYICDLGGEVFKIIPDEFVGPDCNENGARDACDILSGLSLDANADGIPDECQEACYGDFNGDGSLDFFDFLAFTNSFNAQEDKADCDQNGLHDFFDFLCFQNAFVEGC